MYTETLIFDAICARADNDTHGQTLTESKLSVQMAVRTAIRCQCATGCKRVLDQRTASLFSFGEDAQHGMTVICGTCSPRWIQFSRDLAGDKGIPTTVETWLGVERITPGPVLMAGEQLDLFNN